MLFKDITILDQDLKVREHQYVGVDKERIAYVGDWAPEKDFGRQYSGQGKLLMSGFYNAHAHTPMTLLRGYGENLSLQAWLNQRIFPFEAKMTGSDAYWGMLLGLAESLRYGIVSTTDMYYFTRELARAAAESGVKNNLSHTITCFTEENLQELTCFKEAAEFVAECRGLGEGKLIPEIALHAEYTSTPKVVRQLAEYAKKEELRVQVHVSETAKEVADCKERHGKTPPRYLAELGLFDVPATAAHCVHLEEEDYEILAEKKVSVASCPISNLKLASGICDGPGLFGQGVNLALGTDSVASNNSLNFLEEIKAFALVQKIRQKDPRVITPREALYAATRAGALAQGRQDCGILAEGMRADLIVLDIRRPNMLPVHDLLNNLVYSADGGEVCLTMVDGRVLYENGEYTSIDIRRVMYEAERATHEILGRL